MVAVMEEEGGSGDPRWLPPVPLLLEPCPLEKTGAVVALAPVAKLEHAELQNISLEDVLCLDTLENGWAVTHTKTNERLNLVAGEWCLEFNSDKTKCVAVCLHGLAEGVIVDVDVELKHTMFSDADGTLYLQDQESNSIPVQWSDHTSRHRLGTVDIKVAAAAAMASFFLSLS